MYQALLSSFQMITKATADGTLLTRDWDTEPLFPLPNSNTVYKEYVYVIFFL